MRFWIEPSPRGGYAVRLEGHPTPVSHHDTEEEAQERVAAYERGRDAGAPAPAPAPTQGPGPSPARFAALPDGTQLLVRAVGQRDEALLAGLCADRTFLAEIDHADREALAALDPRTGEAVALVRYARRRDDERSAVVVTSVREPWAGSGVERLLRGRLEQHAGAHGIDRLI